MVCERGKQNYSLGTTRFEEKLLDGADIFDCRGEGETTKKRDSRHLAIFTFPPSFVVICSLNSTSNN